MPSKNILIFNKYLLLIAFCIILSSCSLLNKVTEQKSVSLVEAGILNAKNGEEAYRILYDSHLRANKEGKRISYKGVEKIVLSIPYNAKSIPLTNFTDFEGVEFCVTNKSKDMVLFELSSKVEEIEVDPAYIDKGAYKKINSLRKGDYLLCIQDAKPWVDHREGFDYGFKRRDIIKIHNGKGLNKPISNYSNEFSSAQCWYCAVSDSVVFQNIKLTRTSESTNKTLLLDIRYQDNVSVRNVAISTPPSKLIADNAISIRDCSNVALKNITINGTYSSTSSFGYGIGVNNVCNLIIDRVYGRGNWGVFCTNNVNNVHLTNCDINRFDVHCYGRNIYFDKCNFVNLRNQFSSVFGIISFNECVFNSFIPVSNRTSFNAYVGYDIEIKNCTLNVTNKYDAFLVDLGRYDDVINKRNELSLKCVPNITVDNLTVNLPDDAVSFSIFHSKKADDFTGTIGYLNNIGLKDIVINYDGDKTIPIHISNNAYTTRNAFSCVMNNIEMRKSNAFRTKGQPNLKAGSISVEFKHCNEGESVSISPGREDTQTVKYSNIIR